MEVEAIRSMTIEEIIEQLERISGALREGFDECGRMIKEHPDNPIVLVAMEGLQKLCAVVASDIYATFGIDSGVAGCPGDNIAGNGTRGGDRLRPEWVKRAGLCRAWRHAMQVAGVMDRADLESAFAAEYTSRRKAEAEYERLRWRARKGPVKGAREADDGR